jgi:uncharacterized protein
MKIPYCRVSLVWLAALVAMQAHALVDSTDSPHAALKSTALEAVEWTEGFWADRVSVVQEVTIPFMYEVMADENIGFSLHNLEVAAGRKKGEYKGHDWQDEWPYKWIEMAVVTWASTRDPKLEAQIDALIELIGEAQQPDGYISTNVPLKHPQRFIKPAHHEWYNMGHLLTAAAIHHRLTGKDSFLKIANKVVAFGHHMFSTQPEAMAHFPINPSIIMGAVEMYRETRNPLCLQLANLVIDNRGKYPGGTDNWQDRIPLREETEIVGHAVWNTYLYCGAADAYLEEGDPTLRAALERIWKDLVENKLYIHGGVSALYRGFSFRDGAVWKADEVFEATGMPYELPNAYGYNETCGQVGTYMWNYRMLLMDGESKYADLMEVQMFNGFQGSMGLDGKGFFYANPLRCLGEDHRHMSHFALERGVPGTETIGTCCPTNFARTLVELKAMFYTTSEAALWVHHFGGNRHDDGVHVFEQQTRYPWDGRVALVVEKWNSDKSLKLRIPQWAEGATVQSGSGETVAAAAGSYFDLKRAPKAGETVVLNLPMPVRVMAGNPKIESTRNQFAVMRGPLVYAVESPDLPDGVDIDGIKLAADATFAVTYDADLLGGVTVLTTQAESYPVGNWERTLYQPARKLKGTPIELRLIPYFAWANRGISKMSVWMDGSSGSSATDCAACCASEQHQH